jgi:NADP-dependent 3-hydroxy acid dehydrogenase YdfG
MRIEQRTVLITGASSGIGAAAAHAFAKAGARLVVLVARRERQLCEVADGIGAIELSCFPWILGTRPTSRRSGSR